MAVLAEEAKTTSTRDQSLPSHVARLAFGISLLSPVLPILPIQLNAMFNQCKAKVILKLVPSSCTVRIFPPGVVFETGANLTLPR